MATLRAQPPSFRGPFAVAGDAARRCDWIRLTGKCFYEHRATIEHLLRGLERALVKACGDSMRGTASPLVCAWLLAAPGAAVHSIWAHRHRSEILVCPSLDVNPSHYDDIVPLPVNAPLFRRRELVTLLYAERMRFVNFFGLPATSDLAWLPRADPPVHYTFGTFSESTLRIQWTLRDAAGPTPAPHLREAAASPAPSSVHYHGERRSPHTIREASIISRYAHNVVLSPAELWRLDLRPYVTDILRSPGGVKLLLAFLLGRLQFELTATRVGLDSAYVISERDWPSNAAPAEQIRDMATAANRLRGLPNEPELLQEIASGRVVAYMAPIVATYELKPIDLVDLRLQSRCCIPRPYHAWIVAAVESTA